MSIIRKTGFIEIIVTFLSFFIVESSLGQTDLKSLLKLAENNYPVIAAKKAEAEAALANLSLEKNTILPSLDMAYQANYATYNNITGMSFPGVVMPISGPPVSENFSNPVPGSAAALLLKWSPVTFGQRSASVEYNRKLYQKQLAGLEDEMLRLKFGVVFSYLEIIATNELIKACRKNIERNESNMNQIHSLVLAGIRPRVDSLKFRGELSKARTEFYKLENLLETQKQELQELLASQKINDIEINEFFVSHLPVSPDDKSGAFINPVLKMAQSDLEANQARFKQISRSWTPKLEFWGTTYVRGSGIKYDGTVNRSNGWTLNRYNYGIGFQMVLPIMDFTNVKMKTNRQEALIRSSESYFRQAQNLLYKQETIALNDFTTSLLIAREVPVEYEACESAFSAIQTRYNTGLTDYAALIQAQYDLFQAEASLKNIFISSWKSLLKLAVVRGDINIFLNQIQN